MKQKTKCQSTCCRAAWLYETLAGMRVYVEHKGKHVYRVRCSKCRRSSTVQR